MKLLEDGEESVDADEGAGQCVLGLYQDGE